MVQSPLIRYWLRGHITIVTLNLNCHHAKEDLIHVIRNQNFDSWKKFLGERVVQAEKAGMSEDTISQLAYEIGDFLDEKVDPQNSSNRALKELWDVGNEEERHVIARLMVKLAKNNA